MDIFRLFIAAWIPVLKMLLVAGVGAFIATDFIGLFSEEARKYMNNIVFYVFNPSLVANNLSQTFTLESIVSTWFMPINILLTFIVGSAFGWIIAKVTRAPSHLRPLLLGCCASGNLGVMLLIAIPGTCYEKGSPFGDSEACHARALAYASLSMGTFDMIFWSYMYNVVRISLGVGKSKPKEIGLEASAPELSMEEGRKSFESKALSSITVAEDDFKKSPTVVIPEARAGSKVNNLKESIRSFYQQPIVIAIRRLFTPATFGVIVGLMVGGITPIKNVLIGESAALRAIQGAVNLLGNGAIPATTLIMGGNLVKGFRKSDARVSYIIGVTAVRYLFLPLSGVGIVKGAIHFGIIHPDPLYQYVLLVQYALPPAMNMGIISQLFGIGESECSIIFFWTYALTLILFPLWSAYFMWLVS